MSGSIEHIIISPDHNFVGNYGNPPGDAPALHKEFVRLLPGKGIEGDRYAIREAGHGKQITFFEIETIELLCRELNREVPPESVRRNVFTRGISLSKLVGKQFKIQGIEFMGVDACPPCLWMDNTIAPGTKDLMKGKGGLRAKIINEGTLRVGAADFELIS